ncbi:hypothetical protein FF011L_00490 [Roseimaritima multifibrata]|uniref:Fimbrial assembly protein (PilN) n=2 Tax=Roseimaritima multifibrata TaxID=1930274 RepID=A0A517M8V9_9BACT|nr:hypothetical protein FF011L_00490 [Roseimaritima multifibrata]
MNNRIKSKTQSKRVFGLRIAENVLQLSVATQGSDGVYELEIDQVFNRGEAGWFQEEGAQQLREGLVELASKWEMRHQSVAVSLDGHFCVTRVAMGPSDRVDEETRSLNGRIQRYLSLGPGEKITGYARETLNPEVDYSVTAVGNRVLIQEIYQALRYADMSVTWVEPSLVSLARLVERGGMGDQQPILLADCSGDQWDIGIAYQGRLLLDYRPVAARSVEGLRNVLLGHVSRLRRFCDRHREVAAGNLEQLLVCGAPQMVSEAIATFRGQDELEVSVMQIPELPSLYRLNTQQTQDNKIAAVAAVLPLIDDAAEPLIADLLSQVRRDSDLSISAMVLRLLAPILVAAAILLPMWALVAKKRNALQDMNTMTQNVESQLDEAQVRMGQLMQNRALTNHLKQIDWMTQETPWHVLLNQITRCLPDSAKINELRWLSGNEILIDGALHDETMVFDIIGYLRRLPLIEEVALQSTSGDGSDGQIRFEIKIRTRMLNDTTPHSESPHA